MSAEIESRITDLETQIAHQSRTVEELNEVVIAQAELIDRMQRRLDALEEEFQDLADLANPGHPVTRPPHY
ncbi:SlyX family protein [Stappia sp. F7233]|uniref:Protein SlyX homolog n=1 Tax=Stappia albiluteola TaxID=2758565 RepID=A0A839AGN4_9HYPH|nr:SlyX family protein [Stappia albiluteola]MBA5779020.1 SlyX family protein [Stappia albiluteola]